MKQKLLPEYRAWRDAYGKQKLQAKRRGIDWLFTFKSWLKKWRDSGHLHERGRKRGQYVMARCGDRGPYSPDNVRIVRAEKNNSEASAGLKQAWARPEHRDMMHKIMSSPEYREKQRKAHL